MPNEERVREISDIICNGHNDSTPFDDIARAIAALPVHVSGVEDLPNWPKNLHPDTTAMLGKFVVALAKKMRLAEEKYGYSNLWMEDGWEAECRDHLYRHLEKGDPRDVAAYCAFMWFHQWTTYRPASPPAPASQVLTEGILRPLMLAVIAEDHGDGCSAWDDGRCSRLDYCACDRHAATLTKSIIDRLTNKDAEHG